MERKKIIMGAMLIGSVIGGSIPSLWDASMLSISGVLLSAVGGILGIWTGYRFSE